MANEDTAKYRGKRALILTRVSGKGQEKNFSHAAQERNARLKVIEPVMLYVIRVINDTYTGLEYQYREALDIILRMAERGEFDVLVMDVLDRGLGRKAIARELYRMQLREFGVRILTTDPSDHADDDSFEGLTMRMHKGLKAEEEAMDIARRTSAGRREKALGNPEKGIPGQIVGNGDRRYGYTYVYNEKGKRIGYELNYTVVYVDPDGVEWTEVMVVRFIYESVADGVTLNRLAIILNEKGIPTPLLSKGKRQKNTRENPFWQRYTIGRLIKDTGYYGEDRYGKTKQVRVPGRKRPLAVKVPPEEHIIILIPAIVTRALWEKANRRVEVNKPLAIRNKKSEKDCLLRGGFAKCTNCGLSMRVIQNSHARVSGEKLITYAYRCPMPHLKHRRCPGNHIAVDLLDAAAMEYIRDIIRNPSEVDQEIARMLAENPLSKQQQKKVRDLNKILQEQERLRANLSAEMKKKVLSERTVAMLGRDLADLERQEQEARNDLDVAQQVQQQHENLDLRIAEFHKQCQEWREKLDDPEYSPDFHFYQEAVIFLGITAKVWRTGTEPRYVFYTRPREIVELLS